jgi:hypothetical protein
MAFRKSIPQSELRDRLSQQDQDRHAPTYQSSRGGWLKAPAKPVPGTPKGGDRS